MTSKTMWFKQWGLFHRPISWQGWIVTLLAFVFCAHIFLFFDARVHSISDLFYGIFPYVVPTLLFWDLIATRTSSKNDHV